MKVDIKTFKVQDAGRLGTVSFVVGVVLLAISGVGYFTDPKQFFHSYLTAFMYWLSIALGGLFFTMLHHLTGARWSVVLRRLAESVASSLPVMFLLFIPIALGLHDLFHWTHADAVATDELLQSKAPYLRGRNIDVLGTRQVIAVWRPEKTETVRKNFKNTFTIHGPRLAGMALQNLEDEFMFTYGAEFH